MYGVPCAPPEFTGFQLAGGILLEVDPSLAGYDEAHGRQVYRALLERLRGIPGVARAATVPFGMISLGRSVQVGKAPAVAVTYNIVGDGYFDILGIPLLRGRSFQAGEMQAGSHAVTVIDQFTAGKLWPNGVQSGFKSCTCSWFWLTSAVASSISM